MSGSAVLPAGPWQQHGLTLAARTLSDTTTFTDRVTAAADAGFGGIGLRVENYQAARAQGLSDLELLDILDQHRVTVTEIEFLADWSAQDAEARSAETTLIHMARVFGVSHINAGLPHKIAAPESLPRDLAALVERLDGPSLALEFLPYGAIPTLQHAVDLLEVSPRIDLLLDIWHLTRAGTSTAQLADAPMDRICTLQLCDTAPQSANDPRAEALHHRLPPGEGDAPIAALVDALTTGAARPRVISIEIASDRLALRGPRQAAQIAWTATTATTRGPDSA